MSDHSESGVYKAGNLIDQLDEDLTLEQILTLVVTKIVENPDDVEVNVVNTQTIKVVEFKVDPSDFPLVLGSDGRIIKALRTIAKAILGARSKQFSYHVSLAGDKYND